MNYLTYLPSKELADYVKCYWTLDGPSEIKPQKQRIIPDGCMEMIFHHGDLYKQYLDDETTLIQPRCFVFGQITSALEIEPTGTTSIFSVRFHPESFTPFSTLPLKAMENKAVPLDLLFGNEGLELEQAVLTAPTVEKRINLVEQFFKTKLEEQQTFDRTVRSTVETIMEIKGRISVGDLSEQMNTTRKQLERKFSNAVGLSPKQLIRIIRLQATLKVLLTKKEARLTMIAHQNNYYDQAHFIKDFKEFTGLTPKNFYGESLKMSSFFFDVE